MVKELEPRREDALRETITIYLAGPLFCDSERLWMRSVKARIEALALGLRIAVNVIWPWELFADNEIEELGEAGTEEIFTRCKSALDRADLVVALLDGAMVDDGTSWECGYFYCLRRDRNRIIGIRTDHRNAGDCRHSKVNSMIEGCCGRIVRSADELLTCLGEALPSLPIIAKP